MTTTAGTATIYELEWNDFICTHHAAFCHTCRTSRILDNLDAPFPACGEQCIGSPLVKCPCISDLISRILTDCTPVFKEAEDIAFRGPKHGKRIIPIKEFFKDPYGNLWTNPTRQHWNINHDQITVNIHDVITDQNHMIIITPATWLDYYLQDMRR